MGKGYNDMTTIDITSELKRFETHLENNPRTIFSAKFGDGKTYFLREYIERHKEDTVFVVLHPINYSVAANEDVFEYIKRDVLVELTKEPEFRNVNWKSVAQSIFNIDTLLEINEKLADALPQTIGTISKLALLPAQIFKKVDDEVSIDRYFERFADMKGSIFEQDQYSEAIKAIIKKIQENGRQCVLIIEDLDRIDPGHLFRILNVLGAHIDEDANSNKFGFDNIVAVLDYKKTEYIFKHFYGGEANYYGYMAKFMSHNLFDYSVTREALKMLCKYLDEECKLDDEAYRFSWHSDRRDGISTLYDKLVTLSIRDVVNVLDEIEKQYVNDIVQVGGYRINSQEPIVKLLAVLTRLNIQVDTKRLADFLNQKADRFQLLGAYTLSQPQILRRVLEFGDKYIAITPQEEGGITSVSFIETGGGIVERHSDKTVLILDEVYKRVHDFIPLRKD